MADSLVYASDRIYRLTVLTGDNHFKELEDMLGNDVSL